MFSSYLQIIVLAGIIYLVYAILKNSFSGLKNKVTEKVASITTSKIDDKETLVKEGFSKTLDLEKNAIDFENENLLELTNAYKKELLKSYLSNNEK